MNLRKLLRVLAGSLLFALLIAGCNETSDALESAKQYVGSKSQGSENDQPKPTGLVRPVIEVTGRTVNVDRALLAFNQPVEAWTRVLGEDFREHPDPRRRDNRTWDRLGIRALVQNNKVVELTIFLNPRPGAELPKSATLPDGRLDDSYDSQPRQLFGGTLLVNGVRFDNRMSVDQLNASLPPKSQFQRSYRPVKFVMFSPSSEDAEPLSLEITTSSAGASGLPFDILLSGPQKPGK